MIALFLIIVAAVLFLTTGIGRVLLSYTLIAALEICAFLFSGFVGLIVVGLIISYVLASFNKHS